MKHVTPAIRNKIDTTERNTIHQRNRCVIHSLIRLDSDGQCVAPSDQHIGAFTGFQTCVQKCVDKSTPYYCWTFQRPPHKSVVHEVMCRMVATAENKVMPFIQLVGDQPVYTLIVQVKNENP